MPPMPKSDDVPAGGRQSWLSTALTMTGVDFAFGCIILLVSAVAGIAYDDAVFAILLGLIVAALAWLGLKRRREQHAKSPSAQPKT